MAKQLVIPNGRHSLASLHSFLSPFICPNAPSHSDSSQKYLMVCHVRFGQVFPIRGACHSWHNRTETPKGLFRKKKGQPLEIILFHCYGHSNPTYIAAYLFPRNLQFFSLSFFFIKHNIIVRK